MPFYEYNCPRCGSEKEVLHGINAQPEVVCDDCEGQTMQRLISAAGFRLKGGGWYETDFKADKRRNVAGDSEAKSSGSESSSDAGASKDTDKGKGGDQATAKTGSTEGTGSGKSSAAG